MAQIRLVEAAAGGNRLSDAEKVGASCGRAGGCLTHQRANQSRLDAARQVVDSGLHQATLSFLAVATSSTVVRGVGAVRQLSALRPAARAAWTLARRQEARDALSTLMTLTSRPDARHPLAPAAVRVERSRLRSAAGEADQTAFTVWFGSGPALPSLGTTGNATRAVLRTAVAVLGAAALGALTVVAANREAARVDAAVPVARLGD